MRASTARRRMRAGATAGSERVQHLVFSVDGEEYALPLLGVGEVVRIDTLPAMPEAPPALRGVMSLRDEPVVVVDLAVALGGRKGLDAPESCALTAMTSLDGRPTLVGVAVDAVSRVIGLAPDDIAPAPRLGTLVQVEFVAAMARVERGFVPILDLERVLASEEVRAAVRAAGGAAGPPVPPAPPDVAPDSRTRRAPIRRREPGPIGSPTTSSACSRRSSSRRPGSSSPRRNGCSWWAGSHAASAR